MRGPQRVKEKRKGKKGERNRDRERGQTFKLNLMYVHINKPSSTLQLFKMSCSALLSSTLISYLLFVTPPPLFFSFSYTLTPLQGK